MHWNRMREELYDADALAEARASRPYLPPYAAAKRRTRASEQAYCIEGCGAPVKVAGTHCSACGMRISYENRRMQKRAARSEEKKRQRQRRSLA